MSYSTRAGKTLEAAVEQAKAAGVDSEVIQAFVTSSEMFKKRDEFSFQSTSDPSETLEKIQNATHSHDWQADYDRGKTPFAFFPRMYCGPFQGQLLKSFVSIQRAKRILEVGTFTGYGAVSMAEALPADGEIVSLELCESVKTFAEELIKGSTHSKKIRIELGPAKESAKKLIRAGEKFDMLFLDGDKRDYVDFVKMAFDDNLLNEGGTLLIDNAFIMGNAYTIEPSGAKELAFELQQKLKDRTDLHKVLLPINDGILMVRRMNDVERDAS